MFGASYFAQSYLAGGSPLDSGALERIQYGFDRDSRRTSRRRLLTLGEDSSYNYDGLSQVVQDARGNLNINATAISAVPVAQECWDYDQTGNWRGYKTLTDGGVTLDQHRVHDRGNRLTDIDGDPNSIVLDRAGRMREVPPDASGDWEESLELKWDAWGRITQVKRVSDEEVLGSYSYDGMTRRVTREVDAVVQHSYYSDEWRPLEERKDAATAASVEYLWGVRHRDDLVRRDRDANDDGNLDETRYVLMDYFSPASITDETGAVTERYGFSAFGIRRIMAPDWSSRSTSECAFEFAFQGQFLDGESAMLNYGFRYYSPYLGRWTCKDPIEEGDGLNLYLMVANGPNNAVDLFGLDGPATCVALEKSSSKKAQKSGCVRWGSPTRLPSGGVIEHCQEFVCYFRCYCDNARNNCFNIPCPSAACHDVNDHGTEEVISTYTKDMFFLVRMLPGPSAAPNCDTDVANAKTVAKKKPSCS